MLGIMTNSISTRRTKRKNKGKYSFQLKPYNSDFKPPGPKDLVYYELSPGFCDRNPGLGIQGTILLKNLTYQRKFDSNCLFQVLTVVNVTKRPKEWTIAPLCVADEATEVRR